MAIQKNPETANTGQHHYGHASTPAQHGEPVPHYIAQQQTISSEANTNVDHNDEKPMLSTARTRMMQMEVRRKRDFIYYADPKIDVQEVTPSLPIEVAASPTTQSAINPPVPIVILRCKQVQLRTGFSRSAIYDKLDKKSTRHDPTFPRQIKIGLHSVGWVEQEISDFLESRFKASREQTPIDQA